MGTTVCEDKVLQRLQVGSMLIQDVRSVLEINALANLTRKGMARWEGNRYSITLKGDLAASGKKAPRLSVVR